MEENTHAYSIIIRFTERKGRGKMPRKPTREPLILDEKQKAELIRIAISKNSDKKTVNRSKVLLYYSEGMKISQAAKESGVSEPTAYKYIDKELDDVRRKRILFPGDVVPIQPGGILRRGGRAKRKHVGQLIENAENRQKPCGISFSPCGTKYEYVYVEEDPEVENVGFMKRIGLKIKNFFFSDN